MTPYGSGSAAAKDLSQQRASSGLFHYLQAVGLVFLGTAQPAQVCLSLEGHSNSTLILGGVIGDTVCPGAPSTFLAESKVNFSLSTRNDVIESWIEGQ